jgi:hypothetical protein
MPSRKFVWDPAGIAFRSDGSIVLKSRMLHPFSWCRMRIGASVQKKHARLPQLDQRTREVNYLIQTLNSSNRHVSEKGRWTC